MGVALTDGCDSWAAKAAKMAAGPSAPGSKPVPNAKDPNCLAGLSFVFTGELSAFSRDEITDLAKRFGGCVGHVCFRSYLHLQPEQPRCASAVVQNGLRHSRR